MRYHDDDTDLALQGRRTLRNGRYAARRAWDDLAERAEAWRDEAALPAMDRMRHGLMRATDRTVGYVRDEPLRSALMAMAAGAAIYALVRLMSNAREGE